MLIYLSSEMNLKVNEKKVNEKNSRKETRTMAKNDKTGSTAVVEKTQTTALSADMADMLLADAGAGASNIGMDECSLPILGFVQSGSKIRKSSESCYNKDAQEGQIYDNVSYEVNDSITIAIAAFKKTFVEWTPGTKGTFVGEHAPDSDIVASAALVDIATPNGIVKQLQTELGNTLNETYTYVVTYKDANGNIKSGILPLKKTMISIARKLNTLLKSIKAEVNGVKITPPLYAMQFEVTSATKENDKGSWSVPKFEYKGLIDDADFMAAAKELFTIAQSQSITGIADDDLV